MAKKDDVHGRNELDVQKGLSQNHLDNLRTDMLIPQAQTAQNNFTNASRQNFEDYNRIMGDYQGWAQTGGYSPTDISSMRSRAMSPLRSIYAGANRDVDRQKSLQGGYSPGYGTLKARMAREMSSNMSDSATNVNGQLAQMINEGKRFGMQGQSGMYGATPGLTSTFGGLQNDAMKNWLTAQGLQQDIFGKTMEGYAGTRGKGYDWGAILGGAQSGAKGISTGVWG
jgi:hypothetical protein